MSLNFSFRLSSPSADRRPPASCSGKYQGIIGVVVAFGFAVGPLLGGVLAEHAGWRWCFWVTVPVSACALAFVMLVLPLKPVEGDITRKLAVVDYFGTALTLAGCTLVILPLIWVSAPLFLST